MAVNPGGAHLDDLPAAAAGSGYYELDATRDEYLAFHYPDGDPLEALLGARTPPIAERFPFAVRRLWEPRPDGRALDVGCATGRMTLELARDHAQAFGIDLSRGLIRGAAAVRGSGRARYRTVDEGALLVEHDVPVETPGRARFLVGDALRLPFPDAIFDTVVALNLVDRVPDPGRALDELGRATAPGGRLLVASPYTWLAAFTPRPRWLGGFQGPAGPVRGSDSVRRRLEGAFELLDERRLPFFIPHHARSGQLGVAHVQTFRRTR